MSALVTSLVMANVAHEAALKADEATEATALLLADALACGKEVDLLLNEYVRVKAHQRLAWAVHEATRLDLEADTRRSA